MPRYRYRCPDGCHPEEIGGKRLDEGSVERVVPVELRDRQVCKSCGAELSRIFDTHGLHFHWPYHMSQDVSESQILPSSAEARERWDEYVE